MTSYIQYGIGREYIPDWGIPEAIREIYQNFKDYGVHTVAKQLINNDTMLSVTLSNNYSPKSLEILKIGMSIKSSGSIGKHGEGLKLAMMIMLREGRECTLKIGSRKFTPTWLPHELIGETFALAIEDIDETHKFGITFECTETEWSAFDDTIIKESLDVIYRNHYGSIVNKPAGNIYVGGIYITNLANLNYAYDFCPSDIQLERDRTIPRQYDVEYSASRILESYKAFSKADLFTNDSNYIDHIPDRIISETNVKLVDGMISCEVDGKPVKERVLTAMKRNPEIQKQIVKLKFHATRKRKPYSFINDFIIKHKNSLNSDAKTDIQMILEKSKEWV